MITATIVGGFLGAGKTTWLCRTLTRLLETLDPASVDLIVNDFADHGVDDGILAAALPGDVSIRTITSGCICCDKLDALVGQLLSLVNTSHQDRGNCDRRLFIETSGLANPQPMLEAIRNHPVLRNNVRVENVVVLIDGQNGFSQLRHQPLARTQLLQADSVVISKADLSDPPALARLHNLVASINPAAAVTGAVRGALVSVPPPDGGEVPDYGPNGDPGALNPTATVLPVSKQVSWEEFALWFDALIRSNPDRVLRSKGVIHTPAGPLVLQSVGPTVPAPTPAAPTTFTDSEATEFVVITNGIDPAVLSESFRTYVPSAVAQ